MSARYPGSPSDVARSVVEGIRADERSGAQAFAYSRGGSFDEELAARIAHVIEGEREWARFVFDYYAIPEPPEHCSRALPKALALHGHDWPVSGGWGVLVGVARCRNCGALSRAEHFSP